MSTGPARDSYGQLVANPTGTVHLVDDALVHLAEHFYGWCMLLRFAFDGQPPAVELITALLSHPRYQDSCMSPWTGPIPGVHGPYRLETLTVEGFQRCSAAAALEILHNWPAADLEAQFTKGMLVCQEIIGAWVSPLLIAADEIYRLTVPREGNEHDSGWVVGFGGFHEFIAIDRGMGALNVIIGSDD